jgi:hypothetical protein
MPRLREEFDSDLITGYRPAEYRSATDRYELPCSVCGKTLFVDEDTKRDLERASERDLDYAFTCSDCDQEYDGLAYE